MRHLRVEIAESIRGTTYDFYIYGVLAVFFAQQATGIALGGLFYPMAIAASGVIVSLTVIREPTHHVKIWDEVGGAPLLVPERQ